MPVPEETVERWKCGCGATWDAWVLRAADGTLIHTNDGLCPECLFDGVESKGQIDAEETRMLFG